jgi:hypothetical protein
VARFKSGVHLARSFDWSGVIASKLAPTVIEVNTIFVTDAKPVGASLLAMKAT